ncbi:MAG: hypothetical protein JWP88_1995 [Flaviaesturariibacter sp.]|nr:hypothetical protein [Flaviaesturariibacter sp.]
MDNTLTATPSYHPVLRFLAKGISVLFHPLFIPIYLLLFTLYLSPVALALAPAAKFRLSLSFGAMYILFPLVTVLLAKGLGFIDSILLRSQKDRIIPYIACGIYYFWIWYVLHNQQAPAPLVVLTLAIFLASSAGLLFNSFLKISMHAISIGVAVAFMYLLALVSGASFGVYLSIALLIAGLVCTSRLINADHEPKEVYYGLLIGLLSLLVAYWFEG